MDPINVLLAEDHNLVREGLRALLEEMGDFKVVGQAKDGWQALELADKLHPDVIVMDIAMPNLNGLEATARLREAMNPAHIVMLSQHHEEAYVVQALLGGAVGYLLKDAVVDELPDAIRMVAGGERYLSKQLAREQIETALKARESYLMPLERLTPREREVLQLVAEGNTNRQIASKLRISIKTVEKHRFNLMEKLGMRDVTALVRFAIANGIVSARE
jgi:DNA-binding NarL/FixJ family response regulator